MIILLEIVSLWQTKDPALYQEHKKTASCKLSIERLILCIPAIPIRQNYVQALSSRFRPLLYIQVQLCRLPGIFISEPLYTSPYACLAIVIGFFNSSHTARFLSPRSEHEMFRQESHESYRLDFPHLFQIILIHALHFGNCSTFYRNLIFLGRHCRINRDLIVCLVSML